MASADIKFTKTELHTHLVGMLSLEDFVNFILSFGIEEVRLPHIDKMVKTEELLSDEYKGFFCIDDGEVVEYKELDRLYNNRTAILNSIGPELVKRGIFPSNNIANRMVFNKLMNESIRSLVRQGVEYVEISYSFPDRISKFILSDEFEGKIKSRFLLSTNRKNSITSDNPSENTFEKAAKNLRKIIEGENAVGFDIMGPESFFTDDELDYNDPFNSFERKLELIISAMRINDVIADDCVLRIHAGETPFSNDNALITLKMLKSIKERHKIKIPPPEIRIGHGIYFQKSQEYLDLLREFGCIIEINASSNIKLSNVRYADDIPYEYYLKYGIPVVLSTDGEGMYKTSIRKEDLIAHEIVGDEGYEKITGNDQDVLSRKVG